MKDLLNEIAVKLPDKWCEIGRGLGLKEYELKQIQAEHGWQQSTNSLFSAMFDKWYSGEYVMTFYYKYTSISAQHEHFKIASFNSVHSIVSCLAFLPDLHLALTKAW